VNRVVGGYVRKDAEAFLSTPTTQDSSGRCRDHGGDLLHDVICGCERSERRVTDESLMRTPSVVDSTGGAISEKQARERGRMVKVADQAAELAFENGLKVSESVTHSLLLTPIVLDGGCGARSYLRKINDNRMPMLQDQIADMATGNGLPVSDVIADDYARLKSELPEHDVLLPTPTLGHLRNNDEPIEDYLERRGKAESGEYKGMPGVSLGVAVRMEMLPTITTQDAKNTGGPSQFDRNTLPLNTQILTVLPTPLVDDAKNTGHNQTRIKTLASEVWETERTTNWGKFEPAIRRWEHLTRPAPAPTKPDGKDGNHRLSSSFTEWMMGLPEGWVTGHGLKRSDELKMCGNGVVPQQAELALRYLLQDLESKVATGK
jgi:hypothetical protein